MEQSKTGALNSQDIKKWFKNILVFLVPVLIIYFGSITVGINTSGFSYDLFIPTTLTQGAIVLYVLNALTDLLKKYSAGE